MKIAFKSLLYSLRRNRGALLYSGMSQVISSLANFGVIVYLVRILDKEQFGIYGIGFAFVLFISGLIAAAIAVQFVVNVPHHPIGNRTNYVVHHIYATILIGLAIIACSVFFKVILELFFILDSFISSLVVPVAVASACFALRDMFMRIAFYERREFIVFISNLSTAVFVFLSFLLLAIFNFQFDAAIAISIYALGQGVGVIYGAVTLKPSWHAFRFSELRQAISDSWSGGRWQILTTAVHNFRSQAHSFLAAPLIGIDALADINAARVLITPAVIAIPPSTQILMPRLAQATTLGISLMLWNAFIWIGLLTFLALIYCLFLIIASDYVIKIALGGDYDHISPIVTTWCLFTILMVIRNGLTVVLIVLKRFHFLFITNLMATIAIIIMMILFTKGNSSTVGIVLAMICAEALLCILLLSKVYIDQRAESRKETF